MADDHVDHLTVADKAARLHALAVRRGAKGRREEALTAAEEAAGLYRTLAGYFPAMFGVHADRADALATAIREGRAADPPPVPTVARPCGPADEPATPEVFALDTARVPGAAGAVATPGTEPTIHTEGRPGQPRRRAVASATEVVAAVVAVVLATIGWPHSRSQTPAPVQMQPPPVAVPVRPWTATPRTEVAPTGVTLRSAPSTTGTPVGRLAPGDEVQIECGEIGRMTSTETGERSSSWLRTTAGGHLAAVNVEFRGLSPLRNCKPGQPPVPLPHHR